VFADPSARLALEHITHPRIREHIREWLDAQQAPYCILENAILFESGMDALVDRVVVVDVPEPMQRARLAGRDGIEPALVEQMLAAQSPRELRLSRADDVVENTGSPEQTAEIVRRLHEGFLLRAAAARGDSGIAPN
jgi:dephospho-CoA kinase